MAAAIFSSSPSVLRRSRSFLFLPSLNSSQFLALLILPLSRISRVLSATINSPWLVCTWKTCQSRQVGVLELSISIYWWGKAIYRIKTSNRKLHCICILPITLLYCSTSNSYSSEPPVLNIQLDLWLLPIYECRHRPLIHWTC